MADTTQTTMDGAAAPPPPPPPPRTGGRPRLDPLIRTEKHERNRVRQAEWRRNHPGYAAGEQRRHVRKRRTTSPPLPFAPLTPQQKMRNLLEWHATSHHSHATKAIEEVWDDRDTSNWDEAAEDARMEALQIPPPKYRVTYEKRKPHHDE